MWRSWWLPLCRGAAFTYRLFWGAPLRPIAAPLQRLPEIERVYLDGYEIRFSAGKPRPVQPWVFKALLRGRTVGRLDVDFMAGKRWLYVGNVHVSERHSNRGLGTALVLSAAKVTPCEIMTTSLRTRLGVRFFARSRLLLLSHGIELRDAPP